MNNEGSWSTYLRTITMVGTGALIGAALSYVYCYKRVLKRNNSFEFTPSNTDKHFSKEDIQDKIVIHLTGFGKFQGVPYNPTTILMEKILPYLENEPLCNSSIISVASTEVLETSGVGSLMQLTNSRLGDIVEKRAHPQKTIYIHLGVHDGAKEFKLEKTSYNEADFRCPDERGWTAQKQPIVPSDGYIGRERRTNVEVDEMVGHLLKRGYKVRASIDPGRYICNWIYFHSLRFNEVLDKENVSSLFVHVPGFRDVPEDEQLAFLRELIDVIGEIEKEKATVGAGLD